MNIEKTIRLRPSNSIDVFKVKENNQISVIENDKVTRYKFNSLYHNVTTEDFYKKFLRY